jgi:hypothetical protein
MIAHLSNDGRGSALIRHVSDLGGSALIRHVSDLGGSALTASFGDGRDWGVLTGSSDEKSERVAARSAADAVVVSA